MKDIMCPEAGLINSGSAPFAHWRHPFFFPPGFSVVFVIVPELA